MYPKLSYKQSFYFILKSTRTQECTTVLSYSTLFDVHLLFETGSLCIALVILELGLQLTETLPPRCWD